jgi:hypothetical protein
VRHWHKAWLAALCLGGLLAAPSTALAQDGQGEKIAPWASDVLMWFAGMIDDILSLWVSNATLTDPRGEGVANWLVERILFLADYFALVFEQLNSFVM